MKMSFLRNLVALGLSPVLLLATGSVGFGAVTFTNTPTTVSNTYTGTLSLQIGGLTNAETVVIQKFLDLNTNGVIDATDYLVQQFNVTDGTNFVINGVTNINVPGDLNSTTGAITATLNFKNGDFVQNIVGQYLFKLSSPVGHFAPITNLFSVTNFPFAQKITGSVVSNSTALPNAVVILFPAPRGGDHGPGNPQAATVANNAGNYSISMPPGTYVPVAFKSNYVANFSTSPVLILGGSQTITTNLTLTNATASISGKIVDADNNAIGLPGLLIPATADPGLIAISFTDTNGFFTNRVRTGQWELQAEGGSLIIHGYVAYDGGTNVNDGTTGIIGSYKKATSLFYGSVKDNFGNPLAGIDVVAQDNDNTFESDGYTDANGNYVVGAVGGLGSDDLWQILVENGNDGSNPTNYIFSQSAFQNGIGTNLAAGKAVLQNFTAILATNRITGNVKTSGGTNIAGVQVYAYATIGANNYQAQTDTDSDGNYSLNVANGNWTVHTLDCCDDDSLDGILGNGNYAQVNDQYSTINNNNGVVNFAVQLCGGVSILTTSLTNGQIGSYYDTQLQAASCDNSFTWSLVSGSLPPGLTLYSGGPLNGTPTTNGTFNFTVHVTDGSHSTNQNLSLTINPRPQVSQPLWMTNRFQIQLTGASNQNYTIQMSTNLASTNWITLFITNNAITNSFMVIDPNATNKQGFYRIKVGP